MAKNLNLTSDSCEITKTDDSFVPYLASVLTHLVTLNRSEQGRTTKFHSVKAPDVSIHEYLDRIRRYFDCSNECFVLSFVYIDRIVKSHTNFVVSILNVHRLLITAIMIAAKFFDDVYYSNAFYARIGGVCTEEMNSLESQFLTLINYRLFVNLQEYEQYRRSVLVAANAGIQRLLSTHTMITSSETPTETEGSIEAADSTMGLTIITAYTPTKDTVAASVANPSNNIINKNYSNPTSFLLNYDHRTITNSVISPPPPAACKLHANPQIGGSVRHHQHHHIVRPYSVENMDTKKSQLNTKIQNDKIMSHPPTNTVFENYSENTRQNSFFFKNNNEKSHHFSNTTSTTTATDEFYNCSTDRGDNNNQNQFIGGCMSSGHRQRSPSVCSVCCSRRRLSTNSIMYLQPHMQQQPYQDYYCCNEYDSKEKINKDAFFYHTNHTSSFNALPTKNSSCHHTEHQLNNKHNQQLYTNNSTPNHYSRPCCHLNSYEIPLCYFTTQKKIPSPMIGTKLNAHCEHNHKSNALGKGGITRSQPLGGPVACLHTSQFQLHHHHKLQQPPLPSTQLQQHCNSSMSQSPQRLPQHHMNNTNCYNTTQSHKFLHTMKKEHMFQLKKKHPSKMNNNSGNNHNTTTLLSSPRKITTQLAEYPEFNHHHHNNLKLTTQQQQFKSMNVSELPSTNYLTNNYQQNHTNYCTSITKMLNKNNNQTTDYNYNVHRLDDHHNNNVMMVHPPNSGFELTLSDTERSSCAAAADGVIFSASLKDFQNYEMLLSTSTNNYDRKACQNYEIPPVSTSLKTSLY